MLCTSAATGSTDLLSKSNIHMIPITSLVSYMERGFSNFMNRYTLRLCLQTVTI